MSKFVVITSINWPTKAVEAFAQMPDTQLVVVGDKKTPERWQYPNAKYLSVGEQSTVGKHLNRVLPYNHYCRKMLGYLWAIANGATSIIDTDDDNIPKADYAFPEFDGNFDTIAPDKGFVNIYSLYTEQKIWPRGLPLNLIAQNQDLERLLFSAYSNVGIWQGLADGDPDVDAIYRLTSDEACTFGERPPVVLDYRTITPFNSQNTLTRKELFTLLYLPTYVTFRFTDILRGLIAQPIMWLYGYHLGFTNATVVQERNPHDYFQDFLSEVPMYQNPDIVGIIQPYISANWSIGENLYNAYSALENKGIVTADELTTLKKWLMDLEEINGKQQGKSNWAF